MRDFDIGGQPPKAQAEHAGRQVPGSPSAKNDEPGMVRNQMQALELLRHRPADLAVACSKLECTRLSANQCDPGLAVQGDMAQALADDAMKLQVVMLLFTKRS